MRRYPRNVPARAFSCVVFAALLLCVLHACVAEAACQVPNCLTCSPDNEFFCEACVTPGFIKSNGQCSPRGTCGITACERCEEGTIARCHTCEPGYVRTVNGFCASLVVCEMDRCESQEGLRSRIAQTTVECRVGETTKGEEAYMCVASSADGGAGGAGSRRSRVPWWVYATATTICATWMGAWMLTRLRRRA